MADSRSSLRALLARTRPSSREVGWPLDVRMRVARQVKGWREEGELWSSIEESLGVSRRSVSDWVRLLEERTRKGELVPVEVAEPEGADPGSGPSGHANSVADASGSRIAVVSPRGFRVEGLDLDAAIEALERLG